MVPKKNPPAGDVPVAASEAEMKLRHRVAELEAEVRRLREVAGSEETLPVRQAHLYETEKAAHLGRWFRNPNTGEVTWTDGIFHILGLEPGSIVPAPDSFFQYLHPDDKPQFLQNQEHFDRTGVVQPLDLRVVRKDGGIRVIRSLGAVVLKDKTGKVVRMEGTILDITESRAAEQSAVRMARILREAQSMANVGSWVRDLPSDTYELSDEMKRILGIAPNAAFTGADLEALIHPEDRRKMRGFRDELVSKGVSGPMEIRFIQASGNLRHTLMQAKRMDGDAGGPGQFVGTLWDITERKQLEEQLRQSQKMEVVGRVAGGVAHDFNNLLTVISGNVDLMREDYDDDRLSRIHDAADVGAALTRQLLAFSRQAVVKPLAMDLNGAIRDIVRIVDRLIGEDITIKLELAEKPMVILADGAQVQQILLNLAVNARDAMGDGGHLFFSTREAPGNPLKVGSEPARWVELKVRDTGTGMDLVTRQRAFEPFFTTKEPGKGTGLGLSTIADIVAHMKGTVSIASEPNRGTEVTIRLPHSKAKLAVPPPPELKSRKGAESILLVEDNAELRELVRMFLAAAGYKVQAVGRPSEAEALWKTEKDRIDLLITDMVMPEKSGRDLAKGLALGKPGLKTLFISGYSPSRNEFGEWGFLQKPFTRNELLDAVRYLCDKAATPGPGTGASGSGS